MRTPGRFWTVLEHNKFFTCGYCGQRIALYSPVSLSGRENAPPILFYGCIRRCEPSGIHRTRFLDRKVLDFIRRRLIEIYPDERGSTDRLEELKGVFDKLAGLETERKKVLELLPHAGYNRDDLLKDIIDLERKIEKTRREISGLDSKHPEKSLLLSPVFTLGGIDELIASSLLYRRELVKSMIGRMRFFNETLIAKVAPLTDEEHDLEKAGDGKILNIHLAYDARKYKLEDIEEIGEPDEEQFVPGKKIDLETIMTEPEETKVQFVKGELVDVELIATEPGSKEEKEIKKKRKTGE